MLLYVFAVQFDKIARKCQRTSALEGLVFSTILLAAVEGCACQKHLAPLSPHELPGVELARVSEGNPRK